MGLIKWTMSYGPYGIGVIFDAGKISHKKAVVTKENLACMQK